MCQSQSSLAPYYARDRRYLSLYFSNIFSITSTNSRFCWNSFILALTQSLFPDESWEDIFGIGCSFSIVLDEKSINIVGLIVFDDRTDLAFVVCFSILPLVQVVYFLDSFSLALVPFFLCGIRRECNPFNISSFYKVKMVSIQNSGKISRKKVNYFNKTKG